MVPERTVLTYGRRSAPLCAGSYVVKIDPDLGLLSSLAGEEFDGCWFDMSKWHPKPSQISPTPESGRWPRVGEARAAGGAVSGSLGPASDLGW